MQKFKAFSFYILYTRQIYQINSWALESNRASDNAVIIDFPSGRLLRLSKMFRAKYLHSISEAQSKLQTENRKLASPNNQQHWRREIS